MNQVYSNWTFMNSDKWEFCKANVEINAINRNRARISARVASREQTTRFFHIAGLFSPPPRVQPGTEYFPAEGKERSTGREIDGRPSSFYSRLAAPAFPCLKASNPRVLPALLSRPPLSRQFTSISKCARLAENRWRRGFARIFRALCEWRRVTNNAP